MSERGFFKPDLAHVWGRCPRALCALPRDLSGTMRGAGLVLCLGVGAVQAGAWEAFETRCLERFEHVFPADLRGLTFAGTLDGVDTWQGDGVTLTRAQPGGPHDAFCAIAGGFDAAAVEAWIAKALTSGAYHDVSDNEATLVLQSTEWREPRIEVSVSRATPPTLRVTETDLEA